MRAAEDHAADVELVILALESVSDFTLVVGEAGVGGGLDLKADAQGPVLGVDVADVLERVLEEPLEERQPQQRAVVPGDAALVGDLESLGDPVHELGGESAQPLGQDRIRGHDVAFEHADLRHVDRVVDDPARRARGTWTAMLSATRI